MTRSLYFSQSILTLSRLKVHLVFDNNVAVGPRTVEISGAEVPLSTGRNHILTCTSSGSRPPAQISWWRDGRRMKHSKQKVSTLAQSGISSNDSTRFVHTFKKANHGRIYCLSRSANQKSGVCSNFTMFFLLSDVTGWECDSVRGGGECGAHRQLGLVTSFVVNYE